MASMRSRSASRPGVERRRVEVDDQLGPARGLVGDGAVGSPRVLAHHHAHPHPADDEERGRFVAGGEVALLVEHAVVGEEALAVDAVDLAVGAHRGRVVEVEAGVDEAHHRHAPAGAGGHPVEGGPVVGDEAGLEQEVLGRVAGDRQLGEHGHVALGDLGPVDGVEDGGGVAVEVAHDQVELAGGDTQARHASEATQGARRRGSGRTAVAADESRRLRSSVRRRPRRCRWRSTGCRTRSPACRPAWPTTTPCATPSSPSPPPAVRSPSCSYREPAALELLADLDHRPVLDLDDARGKACAGGCASSCCASPPATSPAVDDLPVVGRGLARLADEVLQAAAVTAGADPAWPSSAWASSAAASCNYSSDIDIMFVGDPQAHDQHSPGHPRHRPHLLPSRRRPPARGARRSPRAQPGVVRGLLGAVGPHVGVPGPAQGPGRGRRRQPGRGLHRAGPGRVWDRPFTLDDLRAVRAMKARSEELLAKQGPHRPGGQAGTGRHPRHRVLGAAAPARPRPGRPRPALAHHPRRPGRAGLHRLRRPRRRPRPRRRLPPPADGGAPPAAGRTSSRSTPFPRRATSPAATGWPG